MKVFVSRAIFHLSLLCEFGLCAFVMHKIYPDLYNFLSVSCILGIFFFLNIAGEVAFSLKKKKDGKSRIFTIMTIRTIKFLCYLALALIFVWNNNNQIFYGLLIVTLFFAYAIVEFFFYRNNKPTKN